MSVDDQNKYRQLCIDEPSIPLFSQAWWLDTVAEGKWDVVTTGKNNRIDAAMPICVDRKLGFKRIIQPPLTQTLGPWIREISGRKYTRQGKEHEYMNALIQQLPKFDVFKQNFHPSITNWLPFHWQGFQQTTRYTYVLDNLSDHEVLWTALRSNIRSDIKKARERYALSIRMDRSIEILYELSRMTFQRQRLRPRIHEELLQRINDACTMRDCCKLFVAEDKEGKPHAAAYVVWDSNRAYYLVGGADPQLRNSGASSLCLWEAIKFCSERVPLFDFEGSMLKPVERYFRAFGATPIPYYRITRSKSRIYNLGHALLAQK